MELSTVTVHYGSGGLWCYAVSLEEPSLLLWLLCRYRNQAREQGASYLEIHLCLRVKTQNPVLNFGPGAFFFSISVFGLCYVKQPNEVNIPDISILGPLQCQPFSSSFCFLAQPVLGSHCVQSVVSCLLLARAASRGVFRSKKPSLELGKLGSTNTQPAEPCYRLLGNEKALLFANHRMSPCPGSCREHCKPFGTSKQPAAQRLP